MRTKHDLIMESETNRYAHYLLTIDEKPWYIPKQTREFLIAREDYTCAVCHRRFVADDLHIDHILPVHRGGTAHLGNLQVLCRTCNLQKSSHGLDPASYTRGYVIPIRLDDERVIRDKILDKLEDETA